ncbi:MAG: carboxylesterase family protein [Gemmatimonadota bacterium]|nr:carboxylesterase family protein [Gemmatimonadota bacterium]
MRKRIAASQATASTQKLRVGAVTAETRLGGARIFGAIMCAALSVPLGAVSQAVSRGAPKVITDAGALEGTYFGADSAEAVFKGIPFAAPPIGSLRWRAPEPVTPWKGVRQAHEFSALCPQHLYTPEYFDHIAERTGGRIQKQRPLTTSEDCLYLDVWTANFHGPHRQPVMVWIHGGGNNGGWGTQGTTNGEFLARRGVVLVMIAYRVGALGFLADSALTAESQHHSSGNYGLLDQIAALHWVQRNIAAYGGDPKRVTIFGQSSGALDATCLLVSPLARGLFQRVISESGACTGPFPQLKQPVTGYAERTPAEVSGRRLAVRLGVSHAPDVLRAMRARSAESIVAAAFDDSNILHDVNVDGWVIPQQPDAVFARGKQDDVPLLIGSNADEMRTLATALPVKKMTDYPEQLLAALDVRADLRALLPRLLAVYPATDTASAQRQLFDLNTDNFGAGARYVARAMRRIGQRNVYLYYFTHTIPTPGGRALGAFHTAEMPFVFGSDPGWPHGAHDQALRDAISGYWVQFAKTGNPNRDGLPPWARDADAQDTYLELGDTIRQRSRLRPAAFDLQDDAQALLDSLVVHQSRPAKTRK